MKIPLESKGALIDPRIPTPTTDEDALLLEKMLEEQPSPSENKHKEEKENGNVKKNRRNLKSCFQTWMIQTV